MKKLFLAACAFFVIVAAVSAQSAPVIKLGSLTKSGQMKAEDLKTIQQLDIVDAGQTVVAFEIQIIRPDGKMVSRAPIRGNQIPAEMQTMISRERPGSRLVILDVRVKDEKTGNTHAAEGMTVEII